MLKTDTRQEKNINCTVHKGQILHIITERVYRNVRIHHKLCVIVLSTVGVSGMLVFLYTVLQVVVYDGT